MEVKTKVEAQEGKQELWIQRDFDLPLELLFKAYEEATIIEQWMGTKVLKLENKKHGSWHFETSDPKGNKHSFHGVIHSFERERRIVRTFEMESADLGPQLEFLHFEALGETKSKLTMHLIFSSVATRDKLLKQPFAQGINWAHNRLEACMQTKQ